ncbi:MAG: ankyrin repeat domain-containing protein [Bacteroidales bacterium]|nr:MAG: ankyrin repeat domain-containing protein [Bacteroidales bacterium]
MKTRKTITIKTAATALLVATSLTFFACNGQDGSATREKRRSSASQASTKPPGMDIHAAALMGNIEAINQHIKAGSDLNEKDEYGSTPLIVAATFGKTKVAKALIEAGADMNLTSNEGSTPLHTAAFFGRVEIVEMLLDNGADNNLRNNYGHTALETVSGSFESVKGIYDQISKDLGPLGLKLDYEQIRKARPRIAAMLQ